jgi:p-hydroxybenzoate 3-monooxygenase
VAVRAHLAIIGAGPAGLMLGQLLHLNNIDSVILENRSKEYVIDRVRAGVLEQCTVDLIIASGVGERLKRDGMRHDGIWLAFNGERRRIDFRELTGQSIVVYGQNEVIKDYIEAREASARPLNFEVSDVRVEDITTNRPKVHYRKEGADHEIVCDFIAGCDGFHGICRLAIPESILRCYEKLYPFAWLGILATAAPSSEELVYSLHERGFALFSMRSTRVSRLYLQCSPDEDIGEWPDDRIWQELHTRLQTSDGWRINEGPISQKSVALMRRPISGCSRALSSPITRPAREKNS